MSKSPFPSRKEGMHNNTSFEARILSGDSVAPKGEKCVFVFEVGKKKAPLMYETQICL